MTTEQTLSFEFENEFVQNTERVKSVDLHPTQPWILLGLYSGTVSIWNYQTKSEEKSLKVSESPVRSAKFIARENWIVAATDDKYIRVYNYDKMEKIVEFEEHKDYIRSLAVHPLLPYVVSASDDQVIKLWNWKEDWSCVENFEGHSHYVMQVAFNPQDPSTFASASLDGTLKSRELHVVDIPMLSLLLDVTKASSSLRFQKEESNKPGSQKTSSLLTLTAKRT
ncbi:Coatomer subunit beta'-1 Beta'-coat protein [Vigna angularis]|uniref:Coatomer subunit beta'-1 Beta'-coat protein n=1 Tax=Phaseolus angularis TaxID=3914 RepID=A0A8T0JFK0_PHAAN|nr:Coatomer subunit beta'-1 Beta'-coat protein [Vigna angularis]